MLLKKCRIYKEYRFSRSYNKNHIYGDIYSDKCTRCMFNDLASKGKLLCNFSKKTGYKKVVYPCTSSIFKNGSFKRSINYFYICC